MSDFELVHGVLAAVDTPTCETCGTLVVERGGRRVGMVLVESNRVCWALAVGLEPRLRELLRVHGDSNLDDRELARAAGRSSGLHVALRQHSIESLIALAGETGTVSWFPRSQPLGARATFSSTALLAAIGARLYPNEAEIANAHALSPPYASGATFAIGDDGEPVVIDDVFGERLGVTALLEIGAWAAAALEVTRGFSAGILDQVVANMTGDVVLGWRSARRVVHALLVTDRATLATLIAALERRRLPVVVSVRPRWKLKDSVVRGAPGTVGNVGLNLNTTKET